MSANENYERSYEIVDLSTLSQVKENNTHIIYHCPNCLEKRGKEDNQGKFYFHKEKNVGICFLCNTVFNPAQEEGSDNQLKQSIDKHLSKSGIVLDVVDSPIKPVGFSFEEINIKLTKFLHKRNPFLPQLIEPLGLKAWYGTLDGIVTPFLYRDFIAKYQVRFDTDDKAKRYYTSPGEKVLYSPRHILSNFELKGDEGTITLCEGVYDAIALEILDYPNPLAVLGSSLTNLQIFQLRKMLPDNAFIAMDDWDISSAIQKQLSKGVPSISESRIVTFGDYDPEEYLRSKIKDESFVRECIDIVTRWKNEDK